MRSLLSILFFSFFCIAINAQNEIASSHIEVSKAIERITATKFKIENSNSYKIQLFYGSLKDAHKILAKFKTSHGETWSSKIKFETPNYKVWVGNYRNRLEADRALMRIQKKFPSAFIFKPKK